MVKTAIINIYSQFVVHLDDTSIPSYSKKRGHGLLPREILFVMGLYTPKPQRLGDYAWLERVRQEALETRFIQEAIKKLRQNPRQSLGNHLSDLCDRRILAKSNRRYVLGPSFWSGLGPIDPKRYLQHWLRETKSKDIITLRGGVVILAGISGRGRARLATDVESKTWDMGVEMALYLHREYDAERGYFPLVIINPNEISTMPRKLIEEDRRLTEWKERMRTRAVDHEPR